MKRDGTCKSLWQETTTVFQDTSSFPSGKDFDVIIAGAGITGITAGLLLQQAGKQVLIAEAQNIGFGTSGGTTAHLNTFLDTSYHVIQTKFGKDDAQLTATAVQQALHLIKKKYNPVCY